MATQDVRLVSDRLKVFGVNAIPDAAEVVNLHAVRDGANQQFVSNAMRLVKAPILATAQPHLPVTLGVSGADPEPTTPRSVRVDLLPKALGGSAPLGGIHSAGRIDAAPVHLTEAPNPRPFLASFGSADSVKEGASTFSRIAMLAPSGVMRVAPAALACWLLAIGDLAGRFYHKQMVTHSAKEV